MRRLRELKITADLLLHAYAVGFRPPYMVTRGIPTDVKVIWTGVLDHNNPKNPQEQVIGFILEHPSFDLADPNGPLPLHEIAFEAIEYTMAQDEEETVG